MPDWRSSAAVTLTARVCDQICHSHSAVCLPGVWQVLDAAQALERIKPFLNWLYLTPCATGAQWTHQTHPPPFFRCVLMNYFYQKICAVCWIIRGAWMNHSALGELVEQSKTTKSARQIWFPHHWSLLGDCSMILMAPVFVLLSKPVWLSLAPDSLGSGPVLGQLCSMSKHVRDFLLGFPSRGRGDKRTCAEMRYKEGIMLDNFLLYPPPLFPHSPTETRRMQTRWN